jgi:predicted ester cyclase
MEAAVFRSRTQRNRRVAMRKALDGWGAEAGWRQVWDETCSPDFTSHFCGFPEAVRGLEAAKAFDETLFLGFPALRQTITAVAADGEHVAYRHRLSGRNEGPFLGAPATGREVDITGMTWMRLRDGRVVEQWYELNHDELKRQLGLRTAGA